MAAPAGPPCSVKLLLDVHHSPFAAQQLRANGHDVTAAANDRVLATAADQELLRAATQDGRVVVTQDVGDFSRIIRGWASLGRHHAGVVLTSRRRYHRGSPAYPQNLVVALDALMADAPGDTTDWVYWLP